MNLGKKLAAAAAIAFSVAAAPVMAKGLMAPEMCNGAPSTGEYIVETNPSKKVITVEEFNNAAGENIVSEIEVKYGNMLMTPVDPAGDCNAFMKKIQDTGLVRWIAPNSIMRIQ